MPPNITSLETAGGGAEINCAKADKEILYDGFFYNVTDWIKRHPGGKIIEFYTEGGEDATMAVQQFHQRSTKNVMNIMNSLKRRPATIQELAYTLDSAKLTRNRTLTVGFQALFEELKSEGMFEPSPAHVIGRLLELCLFATLGMYLLFQNSLVLKMVGVTCFGLFQGRSGWLMHEGGHHSLTGNPKFDRLIQAVVMGVGCGLSSKYWSSQHNRHHAMPQRLKHDVDLETLPLIAFNSKVVQNAQTGKSFFIRNQVVLLLLCDTFLMISAWKFYLHPRHVLRRRKYWELAFMATHYIFTYHIGVVPYLISLWLGASYMFLNFALSHTHLPVAEGPSHWVEYGLFHTINIEPSWFCTWWMGYLNFQIEHHLFPTMPQFRHAKIKDRVRKFAEMHGIPYRCESYWSAVRMTFRNLHHVSEDLRHT